MNSESRTGRIIGALLIVQLAGLIVPFVMLMPITARPPENVTNAAVISSQLKLAVFLLFANCCLTIGISALVSRVIRQFGTTLPILLGATSLIMFTTQAVDNVQIMAMMSLGRHFAYVGGDEALRTAGAVVGSIRRWSHFSGIVAIDGWMFVFYVCLYRFRIVARGSLVLRNSCPSNLDALVSGITPRIVSLPSPNSVIPGTLSCGSSASTTE